MPSASGVYSLPPGYLAVTGATIQASQHNPPLEDIAAALTLRLSRDGSAPMLGPLQGVSGTVAAPGYVFSADAGSGLYKTTSGIGVAIGGVKVAEFLAGGVIGARFIGELIPYTGVTALLLTVFPFGQTLSRLTYADLWAFAQIQIAAGSTFYNNGDGTTTFGVGDLRGRIPAAWDKMGGSASGRMTTAGGGVDGTTSGAVGGGQSKTLLTANFPAYTPSGTSGGTISLGYNAGAGYNLGGAVVAYQRSSPTATDTFSVTGSFTGNPQGGTSTPILALPPILVTPYLLFAGA